MGSMVGHVAPGFGFLIIGLWHLFNHIKLYALSPKTYTSTIWFPFPSLRYLEPALIIFGSATSITMELFIGPRRHHPLDPADWTIPTYHLHNFEHASISLSILIFAVFTIAFDRSHSRREQGVLQAVGAAAFFQEFLLFHLHSTNHVGVEGQWHWLLQLVIIVSLATTVIGIWRPRSFVVSFVRSASIAFQGLWFIVMGFALWTPALIPKGCFMALEDGRATVHCADRGRLDRAKALGNLEFSWFLSAMVVFCVGLYLVVTKRYEGPQKQEYVALCEDEDLEAQKQMANDEFAMLAARVENEGVKLEATKKLRPLYYVCERE